MRITGIKISYGRTVKPADYEAKKADVELTGIVGDDEDEQVAIDRITSICIAKAHEMVGIAGAKPAAPVTVASTKADLGGQAAAAAGAPASAGKNAKNTRAPKPGGAKAANDAAAKAAAEAADALDDLPADEPTPAATGDGLDDILGEAAPPPAKEVTDQELVSEVSHANGRMQKAGATDAPVKIRALVGKYVAPPGQMRQIPQEQRAQFLAELKALK